MEGYKRGDVWGTETTIVHRDIIERVSATMGLTRKTSACSTCIPSVRTSKVDPIYSSCVNINYSCKTIKVFFSCQY